MTVCIFIKVLCTGYEEKLQPTNLRISRWRKPHKAGNLLTASVPVLKICPFGTLATKYWRMPQLSTRLEHAFGVDTWVRDMYASGLSLWSGGSCRPPRPNVSRCRSMFLL